MLRPDTDRLWSFLRDRPELAGFVLVGGTALTLRIGHRLSEDLDFMCGGVRLPTHRLDELVRAAGKSGFRFEENDDPTALDEFVNAGMELHDYQRDYLVDGKVKVSFFTADEPHARVVRTDPEAPLRVASLDEIFKSKSLVTASRSKSRDAFDLFVLMRDHGFVIGDYLTAFHDAGVPMNWETGLARLRAGRFSASDEGFDPLIENPPSLEEMTQFFHDQRDRLEADIAESSRRLPKSGEDASAPPTGSAN